MIRMPSQLTARYKAVLFKVYDGEALDLVPGMLVAWRLVEPSVTVPVNAPNDAGLTWVCTKKGKHLVEFMRRDK